MKALNKTELAQVAGGISGEVTAGQTNGGAAPVGSCRGACDIGHVLSDTSDTGDAPYL